MYGMSGIHGQALQPRKWACFHHPVVIEVVWSLPVLVLVSLHLVYPLSLLSKPLILTGVTCGASICHP